MGGIRETGGSGPTLPIDVSVLVLVSVITNGQTRFVLPVLTVMVRLVVPDCYATDPGESLVVGVTVRFLVAGRFVTGQRVSGFLYVRR